ncbi:LuxR C-terminal-related transcriptional regulator [Nocardia tengchongensis]|uniref:LuxR C-terminal-related transcriptional regulator n=1 Tax=Nocardia tengchongensis TaxID=2055889 RepID=UPI003619B252
MGQHRSTDRARRDIVRLCHSGLDADTVLSESLTALRAAVPIAAYWAATTDPATVLFTGSVIDAIPESATPLFLANEFLDPDVNHFRVLATAPDPVRSLFDATEGTPDASARYRDILTPLGMGDELRAALRTGDACWGVLCLHREPSPAGFRPDEIVFVRSMTAHLAEGLRAAVLLSEVDSGADGHPAPGLLLLDDAGTLLARTPEASVLLAEVADHPARAALPQAIVAVAMRLRSLEQDPNSPAVPRIRLRTRSGRWLVAHASRLHTDPGADAGGPIAVILEPARAPEIAPLKLAAYPLTPREQQIAALVLAGNSTRQIADALVVSPLTVQQHLKSIFEKSGVRSRRDLVANLLAAHYGSPH